MVIDHVTSLDIIRSAFAPLVDLPCWQVSAEYGSWLTFHFGTPRVYVNEPCEATRHRRLAGVEGQYRLWVEMCDWTVFQDGARLAHNESDRETIRRAAATREGQKLIGFSIATRPAAGDFVFDLGARLWIHRYDPFEADHGLWHLSTSREGDACQIITFTAAGSISVFDGRGDEHTEVEHECGDGWVAVQPSGRGNSAPPLQF